MPHKNESLQIQNILYVPEANKRLFSLITAGQRGSISQTTNKGTTVSQNGTPFIIGTPKSGKLHSFDMVLAKNLSEVPRAIIAMLSDYMLRFNLMRVEIRELRPEVLAESDGVLVHYRSRTNV